MHKCQFKGRCSSQASFFSLSTLLLVAATSCSGASNLLANTSSFKGLYRSSSALLSSSFLAPEMAFPSTLGDNFGIVNFV
jgi:hypothetical protein